MMGLDVRSLARSLGGEYGGCDRIGPYLLAPGPGHSRIDRSLKVTVCSGLPDGFLVHSFAGDDLIQCRDHVRAVAGLPAWSPRAGGSPSPALPLSINGASCPSWTAIACGSRFPASRPSCR